MNKFLKDPPSGGITPIYKHKGRKWTKLSEKGDSVGIKDPTLKQGYLGNLQKKTQLELEELISRQDKLLNNVGFVKKLADGGKRLRQRREELQEVLHNMIKNNATAAAIPDMTAIEWQWREARHSTVAAAKLRQERGCNDEASSTQQQQPIVLDSDDDEEEEADPLQLLATHSYDVPTRPLANKSHSLSDDPSAVIREELERLQIQDQKHEITKDELSKIEEKSCVNIVKQSATDELAQDFGTKLLLSLEKKHEINTIKQVFKPFRLKTKQKLLPFSDSTAIQQSSPTDNPIFGSKSNGSESSMNTKSESGKSVVNIEFKTKSGKTMRNAATFGGAPVFTSLKRINVDPWNIRSSPLWRNESSATGPLVSSGGFASIKLLSLRESIEVERAAQQRVKASQLEEARARLEMSCREQSEDNKQGLQDWTKSKRMAYRDTNYTNHFLDECDDDDAIGLLAAKVNRCSDDDSESSDDGESSDEDTDD